jgi:hypothetical protein
MDLREMGLDGMARSIWLRIGTSGGLFWTRLWTFRFYKMLANSWVVAQLVDSQGGLSFMKWASYLNMTHCFARVKNSVVLVRKRTIPTERPQPAGEVNANFSWLRVSRGQCNGSPRP